jgi:hypothetical protein
MRIQNNDERVLKLYVSASDDVVLECDACVKINLNRAEAKIFCDALIAILEPAVIPEPIPEPIVTPEPVIDPEPIPEPVITSEPIPEPVITSEPIPEPIVDVNAYNEKI